MSPETARECALALARFEDADLQLAGGALPDYVGLLSLLGIGEPDGAELRRRWAATTGEIGLVARFALSEDGPLDIDLVSDGPHGLVAGTTGAGKSELLRSLVAALAAEHSPLRVNFVLVDYKGGSAFGECAELPHTVGMVTDLDEQLGERALLSLEAELRYRERVLREHRATDLIEYDRLVAQGQAGRAGPLPRLLVVIDEFATLASELPDFVPSLVGIAQRGRSLGVHMLLATQRPSGAVNENIRANTNLRVCLRVQTPQDSSDVIDSPAAAKIPRNQPGRAQVRLGPSELIPVQTALVSGITAGPAAAAVSTEPFVVIGDGERRNGGEADAARPLTCSVSSSPPQTPSPGADPAPAVAAAAARRGRARRAAGHGPAARARRRAGPRRPARARRRPRGPGAVPDRLEPGRRQPAPVRDRRQRDDHGPEHAGARAGRDVGPARLHMYVLDFGAGELGALAQPAARGRGDRGGRARAPAAAAAPAARRAGRAALDGPGGTRGGTADRRPARRLRRLCLRARRHRRRRPARGTRTSVGRRRRARASTSRSPPTASGRSPPRWRRWPSSGSPSSSPTWPTTPSSASCAARSRSSRPAAPSSAARRR